MLLKSSAGHRLFQVLSNNENATRIVCACEIRPVAEELLGVLLSFG